MSEMNNNVENVIESENGSVAQKLDKKGVIILIVSWVLAVIFFVIGFVTLGGGMQEEERILLNEGVGKSFQMEEDEVALFKFEPIENGSYIILIDGGDLKSIKTESGGYVFKTKYKGNEYTTDNAYSIDVLEGKIYYLDILAKSTWIWVRVVKD